MEQRDIYILPSDAAVQTVKCGLMLLSVLHVVHITSSSFVLSALLVVRIILAAVEVYLVVQFLPNSSWSGAARHLTCDLLLLSDAAVQTVQKYV